MNSQLKADASKPSHSIRNHWTDASSCPPDTKVAIVCNGTSIQSGVALMKGSIWMWDDGSQVKEEVVAWKSI
jgi:hypothetical protein